MCRRGGGGGGVVVFSGCRGVESSGSAAVPARLLVRCGPLGGRSSRVPLVSPPPPARPVRPTPRRRPLATGLFLFSRPDGGRQPVPPPAEVLCAPAVPVWGWKSSGRSPGVLGGRRVRLSLLTPPYAPPRPLTPARPMSGSGAVPPRLPPVAVARPRRVLGAPRGRRPGMRVLWRRRGGGAPPRVLLSSPSPCRPSSLRAAFVVPCGGRPSGGGVFFHHRGARAEAVVVGG